MKIDRRDFLKQCALAAGASALGCSAIATDQSLKKSSTDFQTDKPNIVLLYIDDWAWNGTPVAMDNSHMSVLRMSNVKKLARDGMKFRNAYASPQCSSALRSRDLQAGQELRGPYAVGGFRRPTTT
ncbi:MAG: twin-arginine translocation signal domain-containing protein [Sedimentisphaerales bacterium]|nr:twin-arginine translocation signal domain-containing protein [Sedimentisphaerales bacterium]